MWFWWMMFVFNLFIPVLMIVIGRMMWKHFPEDINDSFGYRTKRSMQNKDTWKFAHEYCGRLWWKLGWILLIPTVFFEILFYGLHREAISVSYLIIMFLQAAVLLLTIIPTERALKRKFDDHGNPL